MYFEPKTIALKDGTEAILRAPRITDAPAMLDFLLACANETEFLMRYPEECALPLEMEQQFIQRKLDSDSEVMIVCEIDGEFAGNCDLHFFTMQKIRHRGAVAIALYKKFWGKGIGTAMFREMIALAKSHNLHQLELEYVEGNDRGRALYDKMGFEVIGVRPDAFRLQDGSMRDEYIMIKKL